MKNVFRYAASSSTRRSPPPSPSKPIRQLGQAPFLVPLNLVTPRLTAGYATNAVAEQNRRRESDDEVEVYVKGKRIYPEDAGVKVGGKRLAVVARVTSKDMKVEEEVGAKAYPKEGARSSIKTRISTSAKGVPKTTISQSELDELLSGIDFNDDMFDSPALPTPSLSSIPSLMIGDSTGLSGSSASSNLLSTSRSPLRSSQSRLPLSFLSSKSSQSHSTIQKASFTTSSSSRDSDDQLSGLEMPEMDSRLLDAFERSFDASSSSIEITQVRPKNKENTRPILAKKPLVRTKVRSAAIEIEDEIDDSEVVITRPVTTKPVPSSSAAAARKVGWFTRPSTSTLAATKVVKPKTRSKPVKVLSANAIIKAARSAKLALLPAFSYETWPTRPEMIFTADEAVVRSTIEKIKARGSTVLGWDLEWEPATRRGAGENKTALVQLCDKSTILLVHVGKMRVFSPSVAALLEDATIKKVGVQIGGDAKKTFRDHKLSPRGLIELSTIARQLDAPRWVNRTGLIGLQDQVGAYLDKYLDKDSSVRCGKWADTLNASQKRYAANDVYSSLQVFLQLSSLAPTPLDLDTLSTSISSSGSLTHSSKHISSSLAARAPRRASSEPYPPPTLRQLEAFNLFSTTSDNAYEVSARMSIPPAKEIRALSAVWNLLSALQRDPILKIDDGRLLDLVSEVDGASKILMLKEFSDLLGEVESRELERMKEDIR